MASRCEDPFHQGRLRELSTPLELIYADLCGPIQTESMGGNWFFLLFTNDYNMMSWVYFLKNKSQTFELFTHVKALVEK